MFSDNIQYNITKPVIIDSIIPGNEKQISSRIYTGSKLIAFSEGKIEFTQLENNDRIIKNYKLTGITEMTFNLNELYNTDNLEDSQEI